MSCSDGNLDQLNSEGNNLEDVFSAFNDAIKTEKAKYIELQRKLKEAETKIEDLKVESASKTTVIQGLGYDELVYLYYQVILRNEKRIIEAELLNERNLLQIERELRQEKLSGNSTYVTMRPETDASSSLTPVVQKKLVKIKFHYSWTDSHRFDLDVDTSQSVDQLILTVKAVHKVRFSRIRQS